MPSSNPKPRRNPAPVLPSHMGDMLNARRIGLDAANAASRDLTRKLDDTEQDNRRLRLEVSERDTEIERARATVAIASEFVEWADQQVGADAKLRGFASAFRDSLKAVVDDDVPSELEARDMGAA